VLVVLGGVFVAELAGGGGATAVGGGGGNVASVSGVACAAMCCARHVFKNDPKAFLTCTVAASMVILVGGTVDSEMTLNDATEW
jgi:hypothetical protein